MCSHQHEKLQERDEMPFWESPALKWFIQKTMDIFSFRQVRHVPDLNGVETAWFSKIQKWRKKEHAQIFQHRCEKNMCWLACIRSLLPTCSTRSDLFPHPSCGGAEIGSDGTFYPCWYKHFLWCEIFWSRVSWNLEYHKCNARDYVRRRAANWLRTCGRDCQISDWKICLEISAQEQVQDWEGPHATRQHE